MAVRHHESDGFPVCSRGTGGAVESMRSAGEGVCATCEVVEPMLRRADLLYQLLRIGYAGDPAEPDRYEPSAFFAPCFEIDSSARNE
ncbi:hypothetical protein [Streptomyces sp. NPDC048825]|uniref:hypothetical protein n=1 Tax=Streptomyces sp. NPDC048825 TaxID=3365592 RepID=UPI00371C40A0